MLDGAALPAGPLAEVKDYLAWQAELSSLLTASGSQLRSTLVWVSFATATDPASFMRTQSIRRYSASRCNQQAYNK